MDRPTRSEAARLLLDAYSSRKPIAPLTSTYDDLALDDAYAIQMLQIEEFVGDGRTVKDHKVGLTSAAMQRPPLLYAAAVDVVTTDLRAVLGPVSVLAVGLVAASTIVVALVVHLVAPDLSIQLGLVLGAVLASTDPVAVSALARRLHTCLRACLPWSKARVC